MAVFIPPIPAEFNTDYETYMVAIDGAIREAQAQIAAIAPVSGFIATINGIGPDVAGDYALTAASIDAMSSGYSPGIADIPLTVADVILKNAGGSGVWPTGWADDGTADYTGGVNNAGLRPHGLAKPCIWLGYPPYPPTVGSGAAGMRQGLDQIATPQP